MKRKIVASLMAAAIAVALSACAGGSASSGAGGSGGPADDSMQYKRQDRFVPDPNSASAPAIGGPLASASTTR